MTKKFCGYKINLHICIKLQTNIQMISKISVRATLAVMKKGETIALPFSVCKYNTARNYASMLGLELKRRYSVHVTRGESTCKVTRHE